MFERVYQEKRVFVRTFRCKYLPECSNEKWASPECLASGSDIYSVSTKYRTDELPLHREANKPQLAVVDTPSVRRLRETFEDSCKKCSNLRVMYHTSGTLPECSNEFIRKNASSFEHSGANIYLNVRTKSGPVQSVWHPGAIYTPSPPNIERMSFRCIGKPTSHSWQS